MKIVFGLFIFQLLCVIVLSILCPLLFTLSIRALAVHLRFLWFVRVCSSFSWFFFLVLARCFCCFSCIKYFSGSKPVSVLCILYIAFPCGTESIPKIALSMRFYARSFSSVLFFSLPHYLNFVYHGRTMQLTQFLINNKFCIMFLFSLCFYGATLLKNERSRWLTSIMIVILFSFIFPCLLSLHIISPLIVSCWLGTLSFVFLFFVHIQKSEIDI